MWPSEISKFDPPPLEPSPYFDIRTAYFDDQIKCKTHDSAVDFDEIANRSKKTFPGLWFGDFEPIEPGKSSTKSVEIGKKCPISDETRSNDLSTGKTLGFYCVVHNLPPKVNRVREKLSALFRPFGQVLHTEVTVSGKTGETIGVVNFKERIDAQQAAAKLNGIQFESANLVIEYAEKCKTLGARIRSFGESEIFKKALFLNSHADEPIAVVQVNGLPLEIKTNELMAICSKFLVPLSVGLFRHLEDDSKCFAILGARKNSEVEKCISALDGAVYEEVYELSAHIISESSVSFTEKETAIRVVKIPDVSTGICAESMRNSLRFQGVMVKNLAKTENEATLYDFFSPVGKILGIFIRKDFFFTSRNGLSCGFVYFESRDSASQACRECHMWLLGGQRIFVSMTSDNAEERANATQIRRAPDDTLLYDWYYNEEYGGKQKSTGSYVEFSLFIGNLPVNVKKDTVKVMCRNFGVIRDIALGRGPEITIRGSNWSTVKFRELPSVFLAASALNGVKMQGHTLKAEPSKACRMHMKNTGQDPEKLVGDWLKRKEKANQDERKMKNEEKGLIWQLSQQWESYANYFGGWTLGDLKAKLRYFDTKIFLEETEISKPEAVSENAKALLRNLENELDEIK